MNPHERMVHATPLSAGRGQQDLGVLSHPIERQLLYGERDAVEAVEAGVGDSPQERCADKVLGIAQIGNHLDEPFDPAQLAGRLGKLLHDLVSFAWERATDPSRVARAAGRRVVVP